MSDEATPTWPTLAVWIQFPRRVLLLLLAFVFSTMLIFAIHRIGVEVMIRDAAARITMANATRIEELLGIGQPPVTAYFQWAGGILSGDWGVSWSVSRELSVRDVIWARLGNSLSLLAAGIVLGLLGALILAAVAVPIHRLEERGSVKTVGLMVD